MLEKGVHDEYDDADGELDVDLGAAVVDKNYVALTFPIVFASGFILMYQSIGTTADDELEIISPLLIMLFIGVIAIILCEGLKAGARMVRCMSGPDYAFWASGLTLIMKVTEALSVGFLTLVGLTATGVIIKLHEHTSSIRITIMFIAVVLLFAFGLMIYMHIIEVPIPTEKRKPGKGVLPTTTTTTTSTVSKLGPMVHM